MEIAGFRIAENSKPFIIAEMSGNHNRSIDRAMEIITAAANAGAHAIKLQTYTPDTMTIDHRGGLFDITDETSLWYGRNLYELYGEAYTPWEWHERLFDHAARLGIICFSTPFDDTSVDFLEKLNVPCYKIASFENTDIPLLKKVAATRKPVIMSTGIANSAEIEEAVDTLMRNGCRDLVLLKCTSTYPATAENSNLLTIPALMAKYPECIIGLSDHTMGIGAAVAATALGARVVEKHFTLNRADGGVDSTFSMEPHELSQLVEETEKAFLALGKIQMDAQPAEEKSRAFKRSVYAVADINKGERFTKQNIRVIRPGDGMRPADFENLLTKASSKPYKRGEPLKEW